MQQTRYGIFEILVREHEPGLLAFARSCTQERQVAEDLVQETFVAAWDRLDDYDKSRPFAPWLRGIARNKILEFQRASATRRRHVSTVAPEQIDAIAQEYDRLMPGRGDVSTEMLAALKECLTRLSASLHEVIRRAYREGQSCSVMAALLGLAVETIKKRLQRARKQLRDCILGKLAEEPPHV